VSLKSVKQFVDNFKALNHKRLDILINNAGCILPISSAHADNPHLEAQAMSNYLGHFLLTELLLPLMQTLPENETLATYSPRVINVSSTGHNSFIDVAKVKDESQFKSYLEFDGLEKHPHGKHRNIIGGNFMQYAFTKYAQILHSNYLHRLYNHQDSKSTAVSVDFNSLHPGGVETNVWRHGGSLFTFVRKYMLWFFMKNELQGAQTTLYLAVNAPKGTSGKYWDKSAETSTFSYTSDKSNQDALYKASYALVKDYLA